MVGPLLPTAAVTYQGRLQQIVLGWDYFQMLTDAQVSWCTCSKSISLQLLPGNCAFSDRYGSHA